MNQLAEAARITITRGLTAALDRFQVGSQFKYAVLLHYRDDGAFPNLPTGFQRYN